MVYTRDSDVGLSLPASEPLYLTILRHGETISIDLAEVTPVVPRGQTQIEESLL